MPKRLVVCADGTWNRPDQFDGDVPAPTNVAKLALGLARTDDAGEPQVLHYEPGVGTRRFERLRGGGFGVGLSRNVRSCYRFLVDTYEPGDELYFLGFSRGAYTARSTVGLVRNSGILRREHRDRIDEAYRLYRNRDDKARPGGTEAQVFRRMYAHPEADIHFVGVFDTVGALGIPIDGFRPPLLSRLWTFHDTTLSRHVRHAYHALAIDEQRGPFQPTLWEQQADAGEQVLEQVWFAGVHCDVGGGYADPALSELALLWMLDRARACGLAFDPERFVPVGPGVAPDREQRSVGVQLAPDPHGALHESRTRFYRLLRRHVRTLAADGAGAASSAVERRRDGSYDPPELARFLAAGGREAEVRTGPLPEVAGGGAADWTLSPGADRTGVGRPR